MRNLLLAPLQYELEGSPLLQTALGQPQGTPFLFTIGWVKNEQKQDGSGRNKKIYKAII